MKDCKGKYKVVRIIKEENLLAEGLNWEDAIAVANHRAKDQLSRNYSYEVRDEKNDVGYEIQAHGEA